MELPNEGKNVIKQNAIRFSRAWSEEHREDAEAKAL
jgi:hypothetical protein